MAKRITIQMRLGIEGGLLPESISLEATANVLFLFEEAVFAIAEDELDDAEESYLALTEIDSEDSTWTISAPASAKELIIRFCEAIAEDDLRSLPYGCSAIIYQLSQYVAERGWDLSWLPKRNLIPQHCYLSSETDYSEPHVHIAHGTTVLHGRLLQVGGEIPMMTLELNSGQILECRLSEKLVHEIASKLYQTVAVHGRVCWEVEPMLVRAFEPISIVVLRKQSIRKSFEQVIVASNRRLKDVDALAEVIEMRGGANG